MSTVLFTDRTTPGVSASVDGRGITLVAVNMSFTGSAAAVRLEGELDGVWDTVESYTLDGDGSFGAFWVKAVRENYRVTIDSIDGSLNAMMSTILGGMVAYDPAARAAASAQAAAESAALAVAHNLETWGAGLLFTSVTITERDSNGFTKKADITWPDDTPGKFVVDVISTNFPGAIDAWHATYLQPSPKLVTQPTVTRNSDGYVDVQPSITVTEA